MNFMRRTRLDRIFATVVGIACASLAHAADGADAAAKAQYEAEKARCMSGDTGQTQASCLKSAGAAYDSARAGRLSNPNTDYRQNALARCANLPARDKADCEARVDVGVPRGDVKGGGSIQETRTVVTPTTTDSTTSVK